MTCIGTKTEPLGTAEARQRFRAALPDLIWNAAALEGNTRSLPAVPALLDWSTVQGQRADEEQQILAPSVGYTWSTNLPEQAPSSSTKQPQTESIKMWPGTRPSSRAVFAANALCRAAALCA